MKTPTKQTVYLPVNGEYTTAVCKFLSTEWYHHETVQPQEGYFLTPDQLNEYTQKVIKDALETAAENADTKAEYEYGLDEIYEYKVVDKQSITNTFEETVKKFKV